EPVALEELLPRSATAAGVALSRQQERDGLFIAGIDAVQAPALLAWLDALARRGVAPVALDVGERDGHLYAEVAFVRPALPDQPGSDPYQPRSTGVITLSQCLVPDAWPPYRARTFQTADTWPS